MISWVIVALAFIVGGLLVYFWRGVKIAELSGRLSTTEEMLSQERLARQKTVDEIKIVSSIEDLTKHFGAYKELVQKTEKENAKMYGSIESSIRQVMQVGESMRLDAAGIKKALTSSSGFQGNLGQILLEDILEKNGFEKGKTYHTQVVLESDDQKLLRPDVIINLPDHKELIVDAKAPLQEFVLASESDDPARQKEHYIKLARNIRDHINRLSKKEYQRLVDSDIQFVLMFVPDGPLRAACTEDPALLEEARSKNIVLTSQVTIIPLILLISSVWRQYNLAAGAKQLSAEVETLGRYLDTFVGYLQDMQQGLRKSAEAWNKATASWKSRTIPQLEKIKGLGGNLKDLPEPEELSQEMTEWPLQKNPKVLE